VSSGGRRSGQAEESGDGKGKFVDNPKGKGKFVDNPKRWGSSLTSSLTTPNASSEGGGAEESGEGGECAEGEEGGARRTWSQRFAVLELA